MAKIEIPELLEINRVLNKILLRLDEQRNRSLPEWVSLKEACEWKGVELKTLYNNKELMPPAHLKERVGHKDKWPRDVILEWSRKVDAVLEAETEERQLKVV